MGITRENGYSATIEGFLVVGNRSYRLAKTNGDYFVLADDCELPAHTLGDLLIIIDGEPDSKQIEIVDGVAPGERYVRYADPVPF